METQDAQPPEQSPTKALLLPVWATAGEAYRITWHYRREYLRITWYWFLLAAIVICFYAWFIWPTVKVAVCWSVETILKKDYVAPDTAPIMIAALPLNIAMLFIGASIAVAWHRLILRHEQVTSKIYLRCDNIVWDYFFFGFCIWLPSLVVPLISSEHRIASLALFLAYIFATTRLSLILPARALEAKEVTLGKVWENTAWNFWRICWGGVLCITPMMVPSFIIAFARPGCGSDTLGPMVYGLNWLYSIFIIIPVSLTFLSVTYRHFFEADKQPARTTSGV